MGQRVWQLAPVAVVRRCDRRVAREPEQASHGRERRLVAAQRHLDHEVARIGANAGAREAERRDHALPRVLAVRLARAAARRRRERVGEVTAHPLEHVLPDVLVGEPRDREHHVRGAHHEVGARWRVEVREVGAEPHAPCASTHGATPRSAVPATPAASSGVGNGADIAATPSTSSNTRSSPNENTGLPAAPATANTLHPHGPRGSRGGAIAPFSAFAGTALVAPVMALIATVISVRARTSYRRFDEARREYQQRRSALLASEHGRPLASGGNRASVGIEPCRG